MLKSEESFQSLYLDVLNSNLQEAQILTKNNAQILFFLRYTNRTTLKK